VGKYLLNLSSQSSVNVANHIRNHDKFTFGIFAQTLDNLVSEQRDNSKSYKELSEAELAMIFAITPVVQNASNNASNNDIQSPNINNVQPQVLDIRFRENQIIQNSQSITNDTVNMWHEGGILNSDPVLITKDKVVHQHPVRHIPNHSTHQFINQACDSMSDMLDSFGNERELETSLKFLNLPTVFLHELKKKKKNKKKGKADDNLLRKVMSHVQANQCAEAVNLLESRMSGCHPILKIAEDNIGRAKFCPDMG
jgi:hypothetical protein